MPACSLPPPTLLGPAPGHMEAGQPADMAPARPSGTLPGEVAGRTAPPALSTVEAADPDSFCASLWRSVARPGGIFSSVMAHPFLTSLTDGSLPEEVFKGYVVQGCLYLREYSRALAVLASKAPRPGWTAFLGRCVHEAAMEEDTFHKDFLAYYRTTVEKETRHARLSPYSQLYSSFILATVHERPFCEGLAAVLPCFLLYLEMGKCLLAKGSPHPLYTRFIDRFSGADYEKLSLEVCAIMDQASAELGEAQRQRIADIFTHCCQMELLFFEGAYAQQRWPM
ncbi:hypothetical protein ABPG77_000351 [Micractinium sp. CCAP 211/92]